jgi:AcrR family transcriptional regulator
MARQKASANQAEARTDTRIALLEAAEDCLRSHGYAGLSTRRVADAARMPLSQIHYHFGSKDALVLALLEYQNVKLLDRQEATFTAGLPLSERWAKACDYLDEDLASGYVRVLQEMIAVGWSNPEVAAAVRRFLSGWHGLLLALATEAEERFGGLGPLTPHDVANLIGAAFMGAESMILLDFEDHGVNVRRALRRFGVLIHSAEQAR